MENNKSIIKKRVEAIVDEVGKHENLVFDEDVKEVIAELLWKKLQIYGKDLEQFAKHAKRSTINADDVKLLLRRNDELKKTIENRVKAQSQSKANDSASISNTTASGNKGKRKTSAAEQQNNSQKPAETNNVIEID